MGNLDLEGFVLTLTFMAGGRFSLTQPQKHRKGWSGLSFEGFKMENILYHSLIKD